MLPWCEWLQLGLWYEAFDQTSDSEVLEVMARSKSQRAGPALVSSCCWLFTRGTDTSHQSNLTWHRIRFHSAAITIQLVLKLG